MPLLRSAIGRGSLRLTRVDVVVDVGASFTFMLTSARRSGLARRFDGSTLLIVMVGVKVFAYSSSCAMFSVMLTTLTVASLLVPSSLVHSCMPG